jgi:hypothetical protein
MNNRNDNNDSTIFPQPFNGTVDQLLTHCGNVDIEQVENEIEFNRAVLNIMREFGMNRYDAENAMREAKLDLVQKTIDELMLNGLVEISGENEDGEPLYVQTPKGKRLASKQTRNRKQARKSK